MIHVTVVGLGKIGLPLLAQYGSSGFFAHGADINQATVDSVNQGIPPFPGEPFLDEKLRSALAANRLDASIDTTAQVALSSVVVVVVPLLVDKNKNPDFRALDAATESIGSGMQPGTLVVYETTLPVHTTRTRFVPALANKSGLVPGKDFYVAFSPERVYSGRIFADLRRYPKLVGGIDPQSTTKAMKFYNSALQFDEREDLSRPNGVWDLGSSEAAEMAKLAETTYRDVNIALANEFAVFANHAGIDVRTVIEASNSQPFSHIHQPGIAVGGHCIPVYPHLYLMGDPAALLPRASRKVNDDMPAYAVHRIRERIGSLRDQRIAILGLTYRGQVKETAFSGTWSLLDLLKAEGATPLVHDPLFQTDELANLGLQEWKITDPVDALVLQADHNIYNDFRPEHLSPRLKVVFDGRNVLQRSVWGTLLETI
jgi:nucleotide sugar dehydrogenase